MESYWRGGISEHEGRGTEIGKERREDGRRNREKVSQVAAQFEESFRWCEPKLPIRGIFCPWNGSVALVLLCSVTGSRPGEHGVFSGAPRP